MNPPCARASAAAALDALEAGDVREAAAILRSALATDRRRRRAVCSVCGLVFRWPGDRDHHIQFSHPEAA
jgi:hypothetical protein